MKFNFELSEQIFSAEFVGSHLRAILTQPKTDFMKRQNKFGNVGENFPLITIHFSEIIFRLASIRKFSFNTY